MSRDMYLLNVTCSVEVHVTIHNLGVLIYCHFCIAIQRYILYDTVKSKSELADF